MFVGGQDAKKASKTCQVSVGLQDFAIGANDGIQSQVDALLRALAGDDETVIALGQFAADALDGRAFADPGD